MRLPHRTCELAPGPEVTRVVALGDPHGDLAGLEGVLRRERATPGALLLSVGDNVGYADGAASSELCARLEREGILSVHGNHEAWMEPDGRLAIVVDRKRPRLLSPEALRWSGALPMRIRLACAAAPDLPISVVHSILITGEPRREDDAGILHEYANTETAPLLVEQEGEARVVLCGHTHGPAIHAVDPRGRVETRRLELEPDAELSLALDGDRRYVVDAGSLARPGHHPEPGRFELGTYAVVDLVARRAHLRAFAK